MLCLVLWPEVAQALAKCFAHAGHMNKERRAHPAAPRLRVFSLREVFARVLSGKQAEVGR